MKKAILIPDSFKGTLSSSEICSIMRSAILKTYPECEVISIPVADGGEGTVDSFLEALGGERRTVKVTGPYFDERVDGFYGILPDNSAVVEMAAAASLPMVGDRKDPSKTTTYGVGEIIRDALEHGANKIILGLGGSSTNDAACGLASALGVRFLDRDKKAFIPVGGTLKDVSSIDTSKINPILKDVPIIAMCDIDNPFYGKEGAAYVYAPQKGADEKMVRELDEGLESLSRVIERDLGVDVQSMPGSGAAGGMGGGVTAYFNARLQMGIETVLDTVKFRSLIKGADFIFTGEGRIDGQSLRGKVVIGVAHEAKREAIKTIAIVGDIGDGVERAYDEGVSGIFSINRVALPYSEIRKRAKEDMYLTMDNLMRFLKAIK